LKEETPMKTNILGISFFAATVVCATVPSIDPASVMLSVNDAPMVTVQYTLANAPAVVTLAVETNAGDTAAGPWVHVGDHNLTRVGGAVNRMVRQSGAQTIFWRPGEALGYIDAGKIRAVVTAWATNCPPDYMVVDLEAGDSPDLVRYYPSAEALPEGGLANDVYRFTRLVMRKVPAANATFCMGSAPGEGSRMSDVEIPHLVTLTEDFYLSIFPITSGQYHDVNRSGFVVWNDKPARLYPVGDLSYDMLRGTAAVWPAEDPEVARAVAPDSIVGKLRARTGLDLDLPTDAQWEFACRAGEGRALYNGGETWAAVLDIAWVNTGGLKAVGLKQPNNWGLYDMIGNSWELCLDWYSSGLAYSDGSPVTDPVGPPTGSTRVARGGAYSVNTFAEARSAHRNSAPPDRTLVRYTWRACCPAVAK